MARDLTIRLLGRPTVTEDSQLGFDRISRRYVVEGPRASKAGIIEASNPLFLGVGTADEEFTDHLLVNQRIEPAKGSMDKAYLVRDFVNIRDTWNSESSSEGGDLKKLTRRFVVLRAEHARGYDATSWASHPHNSTVDENDPWDYLPKVIKDTEPVDVSYEDNAPVSDLFSNAADPPSGLKPPKVNVTAAVIDDCLPVGVDQDEATVTISTGAGGTGSAVKIQLIAGGLGVPAAGEIHVKIGGSDADVRDNIKSAINGTLDTAVAIYGSGSSGDDGIAGVTASNGSGTNTVKLTTLNKGSTASITIGGVSGTWAPVAQTVSGTLPTLVTALASIAAADNLSIQWLRATAQVDISNPGVDIWSVSWAAPVTDHWVSGPGGGGKFKSNYPSLVEFSHNGLKIMKFGAVSGGGGPSRMETYVSYVVGETAGDAWYNYFSLGQLNPSVSMDFQFTYKAGGSETFKQHIPNAVYMYDTEAYMLFPSGEMLESSGSGVRVATILPLHMIFRFKDDFYTTIEPQLDDDGDFELDEDGEAVMETVPHGEILDARDEDVSPDAAFYQRKRLSLAGGHLSWSHPIDRSTIDQYSQNSGSSIRPIFSHGKERIWKIALSFVS